MTDAINELPIAPNEAPIDVKQRVGRRPNREYRSREYLTPAEVEQMIAAARDARRHGQRDRTLVRLMYMHGLRVKEVIGLRWSQIDFDAARIHVWRAKRGKGSPQPLYGVELRELRALRRAHPASEYVFVSERGTPMTAANVRRAIARIAVAAGLASQKVHPHMLRHACGYKLANDGHDTRKIQEYLGHVSIAHTVRYTELNASRFDGLWEN